MPAHSWHDNLDELHEYLLKELKGDIDLMPGPVPGEIDWLFELHEDALWFILKYGGQDVTTEFQTLL